MAKTFVVTVRISVESDEVSRFEVAKHACNTFSEYLSSEGLLECDMGTVTVELDVDTRQPWTAHYSRRRHEVCVIVDGVTRFTIQSEEVLDAVEAKELDPYNDTDLHFWVLSNYADVVDGLELG